MKDDQIEEGDNGEDMGEESVGFIADLALIGDEEIPEIRNQLKITEEELKNHLLGQFGDYGK